MAKENGVCFGCGKETAGAPAKPDIIILPARKFRALLSLPERRTIACKDCLPSLAEKRKKSEKNLVWYRAGAAVIFILLLAAAAYTNSLGIWAVLGALFGAAFVMLLSLFSYCPEFLQQ